MRLPGMSQPFLLAPIAECTLGPPGTQVRLAVLGARGVGKSGECGGGAGLSVSPSPVCPPLLPSVCPFPSSPVRPIFPCSSVRS